MKKSTFLLLFCIILVGVKAQIINTIAGNGVSGYSGDGGPATAAEVTSPYVISSDASGNICIADIANERIRYVNVARTITTIAGNGVVGFSGDGGPATAAEFYNPIGVTQDNSGDVYIVDDGNSRIREVNSLGIINTIAGCAVEGYSGDGGQATAAEFNFPNAVTLDKSGNYYISDFGNARIRMVNTANIVSTVAGNGYYGYSGDGGPATAAELNRPTGIAIDAYEDIYIADNQNSRIREVSPFYRDITTVAGNGIAGYSGDGGQATAAELNHPWSVAIDASGNIYIADQSNSCIRKVNTSGIISTIAGIYGQENMWGDGGPATAAELYFPSGLAFDGTGNLYIMDQQNERVREVTASLSANGSGVNPACYGGTGSASVSASGGQTPYTYLWSPSGGSAASATGLSAGTYTCTVTDASNTHFSVIINLIQPSQLSITIASHTNIRCALGEGTATANAATGGTSPYTYSWSPSGGTDLIASNLSAGSYTITATDYNGCTATASVTITQPPLLSISIASQTNPTCAGGLGRAIANAATGGNSPYTYSWSPSGGTNLTASNLSAGTYTINVTDKHGCTATASVTITQPNQITISPIFNNITCYNANNGNISSNVSGGTTPYTYAWSLSGGSSATASGLSAGCYTVLVTDANGCNASATACLTQPTLLTATIGSVVPVSCNGGNSGSITAAAGGGTAPYTYAWSPSGGSSATATGLSAGCYTVLVTDSNGCSTSATACLSQPVLLTATISSVVQVNCHNNNSGQISSLPSGGTAPYTFVWAPLVSTTATLTGVSAGCYTVTVTDSRGCTATASSCITQPALFYDSIKKAEITCYGDNNGKAKIFPYSGTLPYTYLWSNSDTREGMSGLSTGTYTCTVTDNSGCSVTASIHVNSPLALSLTLSSSPAKCFGGTGSARVTSLTGGTSPYTYLWTPSGATTSNLTGIIAGTYTLTVTDSHGCTVAASVSVTQPTQIRDSITAIGCGTATVGVRGGTPGYNFRWTPYGGFTATATVTTIGIYTVTITDRNGCTASTTANITCPIIKHDGDDKPTGMGDATVCCDESVVLFPNPNRGNFTIELVGEQNFVPANLEIYDVLGQKVYSHPPAGGSQFLINLSQPSGIYFYRVIAGDGYLIGEGKIVIQK